MATDNSVHKDTAVAVGNDVEEETDPWKQIDFVDDHVDWKDLDAKGRVKRVLWDYITKPLLLLGLLYLFICSLSFLSSAFRLLGGKTAGAVFSADSVLGNPVAGLMVGVLVTVLVQSSSTSTSIIIAMVAAGELYVEQAVFIIMGANIGTTVTNTIISLAQVGERDQFRRAFGAATVHDMFNWLTVVILLPLEAATGYLFKLTEAIINTFNISGANANRQILSFLTKPFTSKIIKIDKKVITQVALGEDVSNKTILKRWCDEGVRCDNLFSKTDLDDTAAGIILLLASILVLCFCLISIVKLLNSILKGRIARIIRKTINAKLPGKAAFLTGYIAILVGAAVTILVQSSSIFTSAVTPLVGIGLIRIERMYPLTLGSNIGTTATGILAALASSSNLDKSLQLALCHLFFNISGILIWFPIPFMRRVPIRLAKHLGDTTAKYRWFAIVYLILMFLLFPAAVFGLSYLGWYYLLGVGVVVIILVLFIIIVKVLQSKKPEALPSILKDWKFLPEPLRSLAPLDRVLRRIFFCCKCCSGEAKDVEKKDEKYISSLYSSDHHQEPEEKEKSHINPSFHHDEPVEVSHF